MNAKLPFIRGVWALLPMLTAIGEARAEVQPHVRAPLTPAVQAVAAANNGLAFDLFRQLVQAALVD